MTATKILPEIKPDRTSERYKQFCEQRALRARWFGNSVRFDDSEGEKRVKEASDKFFDELDAEETCAECGLRSVNGMLHTGSCPAIFVRGKGGCL